MGIETSGNKRKILFFMVISFLLLITATSVSAQVPVADFTSAVTPGTLDVQFTDASQNAQNLNWDFGDGTPTETGQDPTHTYAAPGTYPVNLTAINSDGTNSVTKDVTVDAPVLPVADFSSNVSEGPAPLDVQFNDSSLNATTLNWDFGDGNNSADPNPIKTYSAAGMYTVNLTAINPNGTNSITKIINVTTTEPGLPVMPVADFSSNVSEGPAPLDVQFNDSSLNATTLNWDFGDGNNSADKDPIKTYSAAGMYTVNLTAINPNGTNSITKIINVTTTGPGLPVLPVANFSSNVSEGPAPLDVQFNDSSLNATTLNWDFGDGNNSADPNPIKTYSAAGMYTVNLTAINANGTNSTQREINVTNATEPGLPVMPVANFTSNVSEGQAPLHVQFNDSSLNATTLNWDFGDGNNSADKDPNNTYYKPGIYTVNLTAINANGTNSTQREINVTNATEPGLPVMPVANFTSNVSEGQAPLDVQFNDSSLNATTLNWDFGDGNTSTDPNPINNYSAAGMYTVNLTAINPNGTNSTTKTINVTTTGPGLPVLPVADFSSNVSEGPAPLDVQFNDSSLNATTLNWDFGDGNTSTDPNPTHNYSAAGMYTVNLTVSNENGTNSTSHTINIKTRQGSGDRDKDNVQPPKPVGINNITIINTINNTVITNVNIEEKCGCTPGGVAVNPEGTRIYVTNVYNNTVSIINTVTNNVIATVNVGQYPGGIAVAGTNVYVTNFYSNTVSVINTVTNNVIATVNVENCPTGIAVAGTNVYVTNIYSNTVSVIDITTNTVIATVDVGQYPGGIAVSPDGKKVYVTNSYSNTVSVIDTVTNKVTATVSVGNGPTGVAVAGTKVYVTNSYSSTVSVIDITTNTVIATVDVGICPEGIIVSPDGTKVYVTNSYSSTVSVIDTTTNNVTITTSAESTLIASGQSISSLPALQPATNAPPIIAGTNAYGSNVSIIDKTTNNITATVNVGINHGGVAVSPDGKKVYATNLSSNIVSVIDVATNKVTATVKVGSYPSGVAVSPDGKKVYVTNIYSNTVSVIDTATNNVTATVNASFPAGVAVNPAGTKVYVTNVNNNTVSVIDTVTNKVTATVTVGMYPWGIAISPDGKKVYVTNIYSNTVSIIDTGTNKVIATVNAGTWPWGVAVAGTKVYVTNVYSNTVSVIDTETNNVTATVPVRTWPWGVTVAGTKAYVAYSGDKVVSLIDTTTNKVTTTISGGNPPIPFGQSIGSLPALQPTIPIGNLSSNSTCWCSSQTYLKM